MGTAGQGMLGTVTESPQTCQLQQLFPVSPREKKVVNGREATWLVNAWPILVCWTILERARGVTVQLRSHSWRKARGMTGV